MCSHGTTETKNGKRVCCTCGHIVNYAIFDEWLAELKKVFVEKWDYTPENAKTYTEGQPETWRGFFDDDYSPDDAAHEDMRAGVE